MSFPISTTGTAQIEEGVAEVRTRKRQLTAQGDPICVLVDIQFKAPAVDQISG
jgi:hypothetical protein